MRSKQSTSSKWIRRREVLVNTLAGWVPTFSLGLALRDLPYRTIINRIGTSVYIEDGAEFLGAAGIKIGNEVDIYRDVRLDARGQGNKICIADQVALERGVDIRVARENCCIEIGESTFIGPYTCISGPGDVKIGKDCLIAAHSGIVAITSLQVSYRRSGSKELPAGIVIEDDCWLGYGVKVLDGVTIGQGSVIGAGAVVTRNIPLLSCGWRACTGTRNRKLDHPIS